jgi:four helix bundle protein
MIDKRQTLMEASSFGYQKLRVWQLARDLVIDIHHMTLNKLPKFELYEEGSQIRRSIKSVRSNIVEGYGRRRHKAEYIRFLDFAYASALETFDHLHTLRETGSLTDQDLHDSINERLNHLSKALYSFIRGVEQHHDPEKI